MNKIYSVCATTAIVALMSYGMMNLSPSGAVLLGIGLSACSMITFIYIMNTNLNFPEGQAFAIGILGIILSICCVVGAIHVDGQYWLTLATMIAILSCRPHLGTVYFTAALLGVIGTLTYLNWQINGMIRYPFFHLGCTIVFALSTWIRVYIDNKNKNLTPKE